MASENSYSQILFVFSYKSNTMSFLGSQEPEMEVQNNLMVATAAAANLYNKPGVLPFLSLCSRYPGSPWAGLLQQTIKEKQANISFGIQRLVNDNRYALVLVRFGLGRVRNIVLMQLVRRQAHPTYSERS